MTTARHLIFLVEELSMKEFLHALVPRILPDCEFDIRLFKMKDLRNRLRAYDTWLPGDWRIVVLVDRDNNDCHALKARLEGEVTGSRLRTRTQSGGACWQVVNRIVIEELEAWYFGDWDAVRCAYPKVPATIPRKAKYRNPDGIRGGTWQAFERVLQTCGYFKSGLSKVEAARAIAPHVDPARNRSSSFAAFCDALVEATA